MAAPAQRLANRSSDPKTPDTGDGGLQNGSSEDLNSDDGSSGNLLINNRVKANNCGPRDMKMDSFQDGGSHARPSTAEQAAMCFSNVDRTARVNSDYPGFSQNPRDPMLMVDEYRNSQQEGSNHGYSGSPNFSDQQRTNYEQQHGGQADASNSKYQGYPIPGMRYPAGVRPRGNQPQMYPNSQQHHRFLSGPNVSPQGGPTPTLNQLLQAPNPLQRFPNSYEYNVKDVNAGHYPGSNNSASHSWNTSRYPQQIQGMPYRAQQGGSFGITNSSQPVASNYDQRSQGPLAAGGYGPQPTTQQQQQLQSPAPGANQSPHDAALDELSSDSNSCGGAAPSAPPPGTGSNSNSSSSSSSSGPLRAPGTPPASTSAGTTPTTATPGNSSPVPPSSQHLRPGAPSPSARSMSPAIAGQQPNIPMPPRPSSQSDNSNSSGGPSSMNQATAVVQGYSQQMAPPPLYGNKMASSSMMGQQQPGSMGGPYSPQTGHYPPQGNYRHQNSLSGYGSGTTPPGAPQNSYPGAAYPPSAMGRMPNHTPPNFASSSPYINSQYPGYMNNMMPPPSQYPKSSITGTATPAPTPTQLPPSTPPSTAASAGGPQVQGAQAAAQAAVIAAASSVGTIRSSPMYIRQHLQQKIYSGYNNSAVDGNAQGLPPSSTVAGLSRHPSPRPPQASTPGGDMDTANGVPASPSIGSTTTSVTQSISSPVPSVATVSSPSLDLSSSRDQQPLTPGGGRMGPLPPPPLMDEASQASNASASSSLPDDRSETPKPTKVAMSHPPTPNTLPSPGAASMSSFHDEFESVSSPSWPRTPASPVRHFNTVVNNQGYDHHPIKRPDGLLKLYDISEDPDRRHFLDKLILHSEERGTPLSQCPTISKQPLDLYRLYLCVKERGGFVEVSSRVTRAKHWKDVAGILGIGASSSAAYTLRKQYIKHILPFECKYDRGGIDPQPIINSVESTSRKKGAKINSVDPFPPPSSQSLDGYPPGAYPGGHYPPHAGMMMNSEYPQHMPPYPQQQHPNHQPHQQHMPGGPPSADGYPDPYEDGNYPRHPGEAGGPPYGPYAHQGPHQAQVNTMMPSFGSTQSSMSGGSYNYSGATIKQEFSGSSGSSQPPEAVFGEYPSASGPPSASPSEGGYRATDPYGTPAGGYPPNRTVGTHNASAQYPYQYDRERYEGAQSSQGMIRPPNSSQPGGAMMGPPNQSEHSMYPQQPPAAQGQTQPPAQPPGQAAPQRYPGAPQAYPPSQSPQQAQAPPPRSAQQYPNSGPSPGYPPTQPDGYRGNAEAYPNQMHRMQPSIAQRLLSKTNHQQQGYNQQQQAPPQQTPTPTAQPTPQPGYPNVTPNKAAPPVPPPRDPYPQQPPPQPQQPQAGQPVPPGIPPGIPPGNMYGPGPKRHPDFMKPPSMQPDGYNMTPGYQPGPQGPQPPAPPPQQQQQQPPPGAYTDRNQYPPYRSPHMMMPPNSAATPQPAWGRDNRSGGNYQGGYPASPQQREGPGWEGGQPWSNCPPRYGPQDPYTNQPRPGMKMPYPQNRIYMSPNKMAPHAGMGPHQPQVPGGPPVAYPGSPLQQQHQLRKELIFPPDTVEGVSPVLIKRRRLHSKDVSPVEAWRLMMALKSGLLAESTWALDVLSILLYDDSTVLYFGLAHMPGLLEVIMEHFRKCLNVVFGLTDDVEIGFEDRRVREEELFPSSEDDLQERPWYDPKMEPRKDLLAEVLGSIQDINPFDKTVLLNTENYSFKTRCKKVVRCRPAESLFLLDPEKRWDCYEGFNSGTDHWQLGGGDSTSHIQTHFENPYKTTRFPRVMKDGDPNFEDCELAPKEERKYSLVVNCKKIEPQDLVADEADSSKAKTCEEEEVTYPRFRSCGNRKRICPDDLEDEAYTRDEPSLRTISDSQDSLSQRCMCLSTLLRNLSFVPGNDSEMAKHAGFLLVMGRLLLLNHVHPLRKISVTKTTEPALVSKEKAEGENEEEETSAEDETSSVETTQDMVSNAALVDDSCSSLQAEREWWWDMLHVLRENTLVTLANISGHLDLAPYPEEISLPILDGLLHWAVCPSSYSQDPMPNLPIFSVLSPQRLSLEALCKLSILDSNVDLLLATPPWWRLEKLFAFLSRSLAKNEDQVLREFSVVLLSNLAQADSSIARAVALQGTAISQLITFVEQAEQSALQVANSQGINALRENPELMGTTLDMVRRAAATLRCLALVPDNRPLFLQHQQRLLTLVMSQILDQGVASLVADVLYECSKETLKDLLSASQVVTHVEKDKSDETPPSEPDEKEETSDTTTTTEKLDDKES